MRLAYFDCFSGISGDMALGALVHAGADLTAVADALAALPVDRILLDAEEVDMQGIASIRVHVRSRPQDVIRTYGAMRVMLEDSELPADAKRTAHRIYRLLAQALGSVEGKEPDLVTFQELGELDCLVDIVGCSLAMSMLGIERVYASPIPTGLGMARTEHGMMPIPSPVVVELLQGVPTYSRGVPVELVSPTGAAILAAVSEGYGDMPLMVAEHVGYGAGHLRLDFPNVVRVVIGEEQRAGGVERSQAGDVLLETTIDEAGASRVDGLIDALIDAGAIDAWMTPAIGRGGARRGTISAVAPTRRADAVARVLRSAPGGGALRSTPVATAPGD